MAALFPGVYVTTMESLIFDQTRTSDFAKGIGNMCVFGVRRGSTTGMEISLVSGAAEFIFHYDDEMLQLSVSSSSKRVYALLLKRTAACVVKP
jgi:hypothetical protein